MKTMECDCGWKPKPGSVILCEDLTFGPFYCPSCKKIMKVKGMEQVNERPPHGIKPEIFHKEQRLRDLADAINRYIQNGFFGGEYATTVGIWCTELSRRLKEFK